jgi:hypothetical protein
MQANQWLTFLYTTADEMLVRFKSMKENLKIFLFTPLKITFDLSDEICTNIVLS